MHAPCSGLPRASIRPPRRPRRPRSRSSSRPAAGRLPRICTTGHDAAKASTQPIGPGLGRPGPEQPDPVERGEPAPEPLDQRLGPLMEGVGLNLTVLSNMGNVDFGVIACRELVPDVWDLATGFEDAVLQLRKATEGSGA